MIKLTVCIPANNCVSLTGGNVPNHLTTPVIRGFEISDNQVLDFKRLTLSAAVFQNSVGIVTLSPIERRIGSST